MAKAKEAPAKAKSKKVREKKDSYLKDNYVQINDENGIITEAMHIRSVGCLVRERNTTGETTSTFIPGVKVKTKKDWKYLIIDNGPKKKKNKGSEEEDDDE